MIGKNCIKNPFTTEVELSEMIVYAVMKCRHEGWYIFEDLKEYPFSEFTSEGARMIIDHFVNFDGDVYSLLNEANEFAKYMLLEHRKYMEYFIAKRIMMHNLFNCSDSISDEISLDVSSLDKMIKECIKEKQNK